MDNHLKAARFIANLLDSKFSFLGFKFGIDPLIGLVPVLGDIIGVVLSGYIVWIGYQIGIPGSALFAMCRNIVFDFILGSIPFLGDFSDFFYKASSKNLAILEHYVKKEAAVVDGEVISS